MLKPVPVMLRPWFVPLFLFLLFLPPLPGRAQSPAPTTQTKDEFSHVLRAGVARALGGTAKMDGSVVHWVLLLDTSQYQGTAPVADAAGQVLETLFGGTIRRGDHVSVMPFQIQPAAPTVWDQPIASFEDLRPRLPGTSLPDGHRGGRDIELAVRTALARLDREGQSGKAVLLVLSSSRFSEVPSGEASYKLTGESDSALLKLLSDQGITQAIALVPVKTTQSGGDKTIPLYLRTYLPKTLVSVGLLPLPTGSGVSTGTSKGADSGRIAPSLFAKYWWMLLIAAFIIGGVLWVILRRSSPSPLPLLIMEPTNRRLPESRLLEVYGPGMATAEGDNQAPGKVSLEHDDLPPAASGKLFTVDVRSHDAAILIPYLYKSDPATLPYDQEVSVRLRPAGDVEGPTLTRKIMLRRTERTQ